VQCTNLKRVAQSANHFFLQAYSRTAAQEPSGCASCANTTKVHTPVL